MNDRELLEQALNDLEALVAYIKGAEPDLFIRVPSIEALRKRLTQPEPELLEALETLLALNENYSAFGGEIYRDRTDRAWDNARAVLKKARGEK